MGGALDLCACMHACARAHTHTHTHTDTCIHLLAILGTCDRHIEHAAVRSMHAILQSNPTVHGGPYVCMHVCVCVHACNDLPCSCMPASSSLLSVISSNECVCMCVHARTYRVRVCLLAAQSSAPYCRMSHALCPTPPTGVHYQWSVQGQQLCEPAKPVQQGMHGHVQSIRCDFAG